MAHSLMPSYHWVWWHHTQNAAAACWAVLSAVLLLPRRLQRLQIKIRFARWSVSNLAAGQRVFIPINNNRCMSAWGSLTGVSLALWLGLCCVTDCMVATGGGFGVLWWFHTNSPL